MFKEKEIERERREISDFSGWIERFADCSFPGDGSDANDVDDATIQAQMYTIHIRKHRVFFFFASSSSSSCIFCRFLTVSMMRLTASVYAGYPMLICRHRDVLPLLGASLIDGLETDQLSQLIELIFPISFLCGVLSSLLSFLLLFRFVVRLFSFLIWFDLISFF